MSEDNRCTVPFFGQTELLLDRNKFSACCKIPPTEIDPINGFPNKEILDLRKSILENKRHPLCKSCWKIDDAGGPSYRRISSTHFYKDIDWSTVDLYHPIEQIEISFSNKCQMMCIYCNDNVSSMWQNYTGREIEVFDKKVEDIIDVSKLKRIMVTGGEPLLESKCIDFLLSLDFDPKRRISIITNLSYGPAVFEKLLLVAQRHPNLEIAVSLDEVGENRNRKYFNWDLFNANFEKLALNLQTRIQYGARVGINCTVTCLTYKNVEDVIRYILEFRKKGFRSISFNINPIAIHSVGSIASVEIDTEYQMVFSEEENKYLTARELDSIIRYNTLLKNIEYNPFLSQETKIYFREHLRD